MQKQNPRDLTFKASDSFKLSKVRYRHFKFVVVKPANHCSHVVIDNWGNCTLWCVSSKRPHFPETCVGLDDNKIRSGWETKSLLRSGDS
jgi:hypothetical protein